MILRLTVDGLVSTVACSPLVATVGGDTGGDDRAAEEDARDPGRDVQNVRAACKLSIFACSTEDVNAPKLPPLNAG